MRIVEVSLDVVQRWVGRIVLASLAYLVLFWLSFWLLLGSPRQFVLEHLGMRAYVQSLAKKGYLPQQLPDGSVPDKPKEESK